MESGNYDITWNASDRASGIYFVNFVNNKKVSTQKIILQK